MAMSILSPGLCRSSMPYLLKSPFSLCILCRVFLKFRLAQRTTKVILFTLILYSHISLVPVHSSSAYRISIHFVILFSVGCFSWNHNTVWRNADFSLPDKPLFLMAAPTTALMVFPPGMRSILMIIHFSFLTSAWLVSFLTSVWPVFFPTFVWPAVENENGREKSEKNNVPVIFNPFHYLPPFSLFLRIMLFYPDIPWIML